MIKFFEIGVMLTLFIISINSFVYAFGPTGPLAVIQVGSEMEIQTTSNIEITQSDINTVMQAGDVTVTAGGTAEEPPGGVAQAAEALNLLLTTFMNFAIGYAVVLYQILPVEVHVLVTLLTVILTAIQAITIFYILGTGVSILTGGGVR